jgi:cell division septation protein DedD
MATGNIKNFELKIGKTGLIIIAVGMASLLCASFLFGVDVGKNIDTYPEKIAAFPQRALALVWRPAKIRVAQNAPENKNGPDPSATGENIDLTFYNTLTAKKGVMKAELSAEKQPVVQQSQDEEALKGKYIIEAQKPTETANEKTKLKEEPKPRQTASIIAPDKSKFMVQVASLKEESKAGKISRKVSALGFKTEIIKAEVKGKGTMFRVFASGFETKIQAEEAVQIISPRTKTNCIIKSIDNAVKKN